MGFWTRTERSFWRIATRPVHGNGKGELKVAINSLNTASLSALGYENNLSRPAIRFLERHASFGRKIKT
jgi:hypothetical protein